ncbi:MAG: hypothetical protein ABSC31_13985 [Acidimicrobiales bacterium]|jgi:hypothetical protein
MLDRRGRRRDRGTAVEAVILRDRGATAGLVLVYQFRSREGVQYRCHRLVLRHANPFAFEIGSEQSVEFFTVTWEQTEFFVGEDTYVGPIRVLVRGLARHGLVIAEGVAENGLRVTAAGRNPTIVLGCARPDIVFEVVRAFAFAKNLRAHNALVAFAFFRRFAASVLPIN